jgi:16S rRNA (cytosine967-C5)-methyltransferase
MSTQGLKSRLQALAILKNCIFSKKSIVWGEAETNLSRQDLAFVQLLVRNVLKKHGQNKKRLEMVLSKPYDDLNPTVQLILQLAVTQIFDLSVPPYAATQTALLCAEQTKVAHLKGLINGVLRGLIRQMPQLNVPSAAANIPSWLLQNWEKHYGRETALQIAESCLDEPGLDIVVKNNIRLWEQMLEGNAIYQNVIRRSFGGRIEDMNGYVQGDWWVQDLSSTLPVQLLAPKKGEKILDLCAAPGGKTALLCYHEADVTSVDISAKRLEVLEKNLTRLGYASHIVACDAKLVNFEERFDGILVDAPCSGTGVLRRHPDILHTRQQQDLLSLQGLQKDILKNAIKFLKPGGRLVYSTCSLEPQEGEEVIEMILKEFPTIRRKKIEDQFFAPLPLKPTPKGDIRTFPFYMRDQKGMDGFFIALLQKDAA